MHSKTQIHVINVRIYHFKHLWRELHSTLCLKERYHPTINDNFNSSGPIPAIFGTYIPVRICHWKVVYFPTSPA